MKNFLLPLLTLFLFLVLMPGCSTQDNPTPTDPPDDPEDPPALEGRLGAEHFSYQGAFRLPAGDGSVASFAYGGWSMTHCPSGDPEGSDSTPGSLYISGHAWEHQVAEVSIPQPRVSEGDVSVLERATLLRPFTTVFPVANLEIPRVGLAWLPRQEGMAGDRLALCWGYHMQEEPADPTHGWCRPDLSGFQGSWYLENLPVYRQNMSTNDYLFMLPATYASSFQGRLLLTGRFRDGGWSGQGPALFAIAPWLEGDPPPHGCALPHTPLLLYDSTMEGEGGQTMAGYHHSDEWNGAALATSSTRQAVVFSGTKGEGDCWYGNPQGPCLDCEDRGWWSTRFSGVLLLYDLNDLIRVVRGEISPATPQPYLTLPVDEHLFAITSEQQKHHLGACAFDEQNHLLYVAELLADEDRPLIHVWQILED